MRNRESAREKPKSLKHQQRLTPLNMDMKNDLRRHIDRVAALFESLDPVRFLERFRGVAELATRGATEGERAAATEAVDRLINRVKEEIERARKNRGSVDTLERLLAKMTGQSPQTEPQEREREWGPTEHAFDDEFEQEWPMHFAIARALGGKVHPFDKYQGPYISVPGGKLWIAFDEDAPDWATVYNELNLKSSDPFWPHGSQAEADAIKAARSVLHSPASSAKRNPRNHKFG